MTEEEVVKIRNSMPDKPVVEPVDERTVLVFNLCKGFKHGSIPYWAKALDVMSEKTGAFKVVHSADMKIFSSESLQQFDAICFNNTTKLTPDASQQRAIMDFIKSGKGIAGIHAATDNFYDWPEGKEMMGGVFTGHPWTANGTWAVKIDEPDHPLMKPFAEKGFKINDEIYRTAPPLYSRKNQRVLMSLDMSDPTTKNAKGVKPSDMDTGITWIKRVGKGRLFYCSLGHNNHLTWNKPVLEHFLAGIQYALGDLHVDDSIPPATLDVEKLDTLIGEMKAYDWSKNRVPLIQLETLIKEHYSNPETLSLIESKLDDMLTSDMSPATIDFVCRKLAVIGSEASVKPLLLLLDDPKTANQCCFALEKIASPAVDQGLLKKLNTVKDTDVKIGIINTLGVRGSEDAVAPLGNLVRSPDNKIASAAVRALGQIPSRSAVDMLSLSSKRTENTALKTELQDALLGCSQKMAQMDASYRTASNTRNMYRDLYAENNASLIRVAAFRALIHSGHPDSDDLLLAAVQDKDSVVRSAAAQILSDFDDEQVLKSAAAMLLDLPDEAKVQLITALSESPKKEGVEQIVKLVGSENQSVRLAVYTAISKMGDTAMVPVLAEAAGKSTDRREREAVQSALNLMDAPDVDSTIVRMISETAENPDAEQATIALIRSAADRQIADAPEVLFRVAMSESKRAALEAVRALQKLAGPEYMEEMVQLLADRPSKSTEEATVVIAGRIPDENSRTDLLEQTYLEVGQSTTVKVSILRVFGHLGCAKVVPLIRKAYAGSDNEIKTAAFRAMVNWRGDAFIDEVKSLAENEQEEKTKILALRGYIRMLTEHSTMEQSEIVKALIATYPLATRSEEQQLVISAIGNYGNRQALEFVTVALKESALKAEAELSAVSICEKIATRDYASVKDILEQIDTQTTNKLLKKRIRALADKMAKVKGFVLGWQYSGPYQKANMNSDSLVDQVFAPEQNPGQCKWLELPAMTDASRPWMLDLKWIDSANSRVVYLKTTVVSEREVAAILAVGSDDSVKIWLNGTVVHSNKTSRGVDPRQDIANVKLQKGNNELLVKVTQGSGDWAFCMEILDNTSNPLEGIKVVAW